MRDDDGFDDDDNPPPPDLENDPEYDKLLEDWLKGAIGYDKLREREKELKCDFDDDEQKEDDEDNLDPHTHAANESGDMDTGDDDDFEPRFGHPED